MPLPTLVGFPFFSFAPFFFLDDERLCFDDDDSTSLSA